MSSGLRKRRGQTMRKREKDGFTTHHCRKGIHHQTVGYPLPDQEQIVPDGRVRTSASKSNHHASDIHTPV